MWPYHRWRKSFGIIGYVCTRCLRNNRGWQRAWKAPAPCVNCGRPVAHDYHRLTPKHVVCGAACKGALRNKPHLLRAPLHEFPCLMCTETFLAKRPDAFYCSSSCRQQAYRQRRRAKAEP